MFDLNSMIINVGTASNFVVTILLLQNGKWSQIKWKNPRKFYIIVYIIVSVEKKVLLAEVGIKMLCLVMV